MWDPYADLKKVVLDNGLTIYWLYADRPFVYVDFVVHSGAFQDSIPGLAHFAEHLVARGTSNRGKEFLRIVRNEGGSVNMGKTSVVTTTYGAKIPARRFEETIELFASMFSSGLSATKEDVESEHSIILREYAQRLTPTSAKYIRLKRRALYPGGHLMRDFLRPLGTQESIRAITLDHAREFLQRHYVARNISIVVMGGAPNALSVIASRFGRMATGTWNRPKLPEIEIPPPSVARINVPWTELGSERPHGCRIDWHFAMPGSPMLLTRLCEIVIDRIDDDLRRKRNATYGFFREVTPYVIADEGYIGGEVSWELRADVGEVYDRALAQAIGDTNRLEELRAAAIARVRMEDWKIGDIRGSLLSNLENDEDVESFEAAVTNLEGLTVEEMQATLRRLERRNTVSLELSDS